MRPARNIVATATLLLISTTLLGCATPEKRATETPEWTMNGVGLFIGPGKVLYGVGIAPAVKKRGLSQKMASNRARAVLASFVADFGKTMLNTRKEDARKRTVIQFAEEQDGQTYGDMRRACNRALFGAGMRVVCHWVDPTDSSVYALARVEFDTFLDELLKNRGYSRRDHEYFTKNADRVFNTVAGKHTTGHAEADWP
jgi:hypothetical protein